MEKICSLLLCLALLCTVFPLGAVSVSAATYSGTCGDNLTWSLETATGTLTISGTGAMEDYSDISAVPWHSYCYSIKTVNISKNATTIGDYAFSGCTGLTNITIPDSVKTIGSSAFFRCDNLQYNQYDNALYLGNATNPYLYLATATSTDITSCSIHDNTRFIGEYAFMECMELTNITIPDSVTTIGDSAFFNCFELTSATIGSSVTTIGNSAFSYCEGLTSVTVPNSVTTIDPWAFYGCWNLTSITIPSSVTTIGCFAFDGCDSLNYNQYDNAYYLGNEGDSYLYLAKATSTDITSCLICENTRFIGGWAFKDCAKLTRITIPDGVTTIDDYAFPSCSELTNITIPNSITTIGAYAFYDCLGLTDVYYAGTEHEWNNTSIKGGSESLTNANIHFSATYCSVNGHDFSKTSAAGLLVCAHCGKTERRSEDLKVGTQTHKNGNTRLILKLSASTKEIEAYQEVSFVVSVRGEKTVITVDNVYDSFYNNGTLVSAEDLNCTYVSILEIGNIYNAKSVTVQGFYTDKNGKTIHGTVKTVR